MSKTAVWNSGRTDTPTFPVIREWRFGDDTLIQCVENPHEECEETTFISGAMADEGIANDLDKNGYQIKELRLNDDGCVYGYVWNDGYVTEFWDCDEETWSEYAKEIGE